MRKQLSIKCLLFAVVAQAAVAVRGDIAAPSVNYQALSPIPWFLQKHGLSSMWARGLGWGLSLSLAFIILYYLIARRKSNCTFRHCVWRNLVRCLVICFACLAMSLVLQEIEHVKMGMAIMTMKGSYDLSVEAEPNETYSQYLERVRRLEGDLCLKCGTKREHWYYKGKHSGCPKCEKLHEEGICRVCGKEYKRLVGRNREVAREFELGVCNNCINLARKGYPTAGTDPGVAEGRLSD